MVTSSGTEPGPSAIHVVGSYGAAEPARVLPRVEDLMARLEVLWARGGAVLETGQYVTDHARELVARLIALTRRATERCKDDEEAVARHDDEVRRWRERALDAARWVQESEALVARAYASAEASHEHWRGQLDAAKAWRQRARHAVQVAQSQRDECQARLGYAYNALSNAESALASARHRTEYAGQDAQGRAVYRPISTHSYEAAVSSARIEVSRCESNLARAESILAEAREDLRRAEARVLACERAVEAAAVACAEAQTARARAAHARACAERASEEQLVLEQLADQGRAALAGEVEAVEHMGDSVQDATYAEETARNHLLRADRLQNDAREAACRARLELDWRMTRLRAFDTPWPM